MMMNNIKFDGRIFKHTEAAAQAVSDVKWARSVLASDAITFQNGRNSHHVAAEVLDAAEDALLDAQLFTA